MSIDRGMDKDSVVPTPHTHTHTLEYYSAIKKKERMPLAERHDGPRDCHAELSKSEKDKYMILLTCVI